VLDAILEEYVVKALAYVAIVAKRNFRPIVQRVLRLMGTCGVQTPSVPAPRFENVTTQGFGVGRAHSDRPTGFRSIPRLRQIEGVKSAGYLKKL